MNIIPTFEERISTWEKQIKDIKKCDTPGILPSPPDPRDFNVDDLPVGVSVLPEKKILPLSPIILNQGQTPYCAGAAGAAVSNAHFNNLGEMPRNGFSMTFLYWLAKRYDGIPEVSGTYIRTLLKIMQKYGSSPLDYAPYSTSQISITHEALTRAEEYKIGSYARLSSMHDIKKALVKNNYVIIGTLVTRDNWNRAGGYLSKPAGSLYGGHATFLFGYNDFITREHEGYFYGQNSWGSNWGDNGRFYLPYDYYNMAYDNRSVFLEAWAVNFTPVKRRVPVNPISYINNNNPFEDIAKHIRDRLREIRDRLTRR